MKYGVGIDVGGTKIACALINNKGNIRKKIIFHTARTKGKVLKQIIKGVSLLLEGVKKDVVGIGIGIPGVKDSKGRIYRLPNLKILNGVDLVGVLKKKFNKRVVMENDASCAALGEYKFGVGKDVKTLFVVTLGTGIGGGFVLNGKLYTGRGNAPEPGHMLIGKKEWETVASGRAFIESFKKKGKKSYGEYANHLGIGLSNIAKLYDPEVIVLTGGAVKSKNCFLKKAINVAEKNTFFKIGKIVASRFPENAGIIGAASLVL